MFKQQDTKDKRSMSLSEQARFIIRSIPRDVESQVSLASPLLRTQLLLFSATFSETVFTFIQRVATNAVIFRKKDKELKLENVPLVSSFSLFSNDQYYISCKTDLNECHTDAIVVASINKTQKKLDLVSIPRDVLIYVPGVPLISFI